MTSAGKLTAAEFNELVAQVKHNTPQRVESEEAYQKMINDGTIDPEQLYYIPADAE